MRRVMDAMRSGGLFLASFSTYSRLHGSASHMADDKGGLGSAESRIHPLLVSKRFWNQKVYIQD
jgi:hypothetical protein